MDKLLTPSRGKRLYNEILHLNPVAYYPLNEGNGLVAKNHASANRGSLDGTITGSTLGQPGKVGKAFSFPGLTGNNVSLGTSSSLNPTAAMTTMAIFKYNTSGRPMISRDVAIQSKRDYILQAAATDQLEVDFWVGGALKQVKAGTLVAGKWHIGIGVYDGSFVRAYVDGLSVGTPTAASGSLTTHSDISTYIGMNGENTSFFDGLIQHVALFDRALSAGEVKKIARIGGFI